jgi:hypothetical protein
VAEQLWDTHIFQQTRDLRELGYLGGDGVAVFREKLVDFSGRCRGVNIATNVASKLIEKYRNRGQKAERVRRGWEFAAYKAQVLRLRRREPGLWTGSRDVTLRY